MIYGDNILSSVVADWEIINGSMSPTTLVLSAGGCAKLNIDPAKVAAMPEAIMLSIVATPYTGAYSGGSYATIKVTAEDDIVYSYNIIINDTGGGTCVVEIPTEAIKYKKLEFIITTKNLITITDWALFMPKLSDVDLTVITDKLPRLLKDYNESTLIIGQEEETIAMISSYIMETTELTGNLEFSYIATESTTLVIRIKDNEKSELYTPIMTNISAGMGAVGIPHAYLTRIKGYHNFTITVQAINGLITIDTRKVMYTIDGGRIVYNVMDVGSVVYDLSVRKLSTEQTPSYIFAVCIDEGICIVKQCQYSDTPGAAWISIANLGKAIDATIDFNGTWYINSTPYIFNTDEFPWVAWVTPEGELKVKRLDSDSTLFTLATGVSKVSMVKGWDNPVNLGNDQGLLVGYIKNADNKVYYRGYCTQAGGNNMWEPERQLGEFIGTATDINLFRTNDFRVGFNVLDRLGVSYSYITTRNWTGMSVPPISINSAIVDPLVTVIPINYMNGFTDSEKITGGFTDAVIDIAPAGYLSSNVKILTAKRIDNNNIKVEFSHDLINVGGQELQFTVQNNTVTATRAGDNDKEIIITTLIPLSSVGNWKVTYTKINTGIRVAIADYFKPLLENQAILASGDPPNHIEFMQGSLIAPVVSVIRVAYSDTYNTEKISGVWRDAVVSVVKIGTSPL